MRNVAFVALGSLLVLACGTFAADDDKVSANDLKRIGLAYHNYHDKHNKAPAKAEDLGPFVENEKRLVGLLTSEKVVFAYEVGIFDMKEGTSKTILAYEKSVPDKGGLVLYGDGSVKTVTAEEFKKIPLAKKKK